MNKFLLILLLFSFPASAEIYRWVDENGQTHFSTELPVQQKGEEVDVKVYSYTSVSTEPAKPSTSLPVKKAVANKEVVMFATSWCGYCRKARNYFAKKNIDYTEYDIEKSRAARKAYDSMGARGVPVILVGKNRMNGFSEASFDRLYK